MDDDKLVFPILIKLLNQNITDFDSIYQTISNELLSEKYFLSVLDLFDLSQLYYGKYQHYPSSLEEL